MESLERNDRPDQSSSLLDQDPEKFDFVKQAPSHKRQSEVVGGRFIEGPTAWTFLWA